MGESGPEGASELKLAAIHVDAGDLATVALRLRRELEENLRPHATGIMNEFHQGVGFGWRSASEPLSASRDQYDRCLRTAITALGFYLDSTEALTIAMEQAAAMYRETDAAAAGATVEQSYGTTLAGLQDQRGADAIRDAHVITTP